MITEQEKRTKDGKAGFTILEVLVAVCILSFGLLAVATMQTGSIRGNDTAYRQTECTSLAQDRIERLLALPYDDAALDDGAGKADPFGGAPAMYTITYSVDDGNDTSGSWQNKPGSKLITVTVTRTGLGIAHRPVQFSTLKLEIS